MGETKTPLFRWKLYGNGTSINPGDVVLPSKRLSQPCTAGTGAQHVAAMFSVMFFAPLLTGFPSLTTLSFTATGTLLLFLITAGRLPSYLGSSFVLIVPIQAISPSMGPPYTLSDIIAVGATLILVGLIVHFAGMRWIDAVMPSMVTGAIVALIGLNLVPATWDWVEQGPIIAVVTIVSICVVTVLSKDILGRLSTLIGVLIGYLVAIYQGEVDFSKVSNAAWIGFPEFHTPAFSFPTLGLFLPVAFILTAENVGRTGLVSAVTGENIDDLTGRALVADGLPTMLAGSDGGSGATTYAKNVDVTIATRVYSTAACIIATSVVLVLSMLPKFGALIVTILPGILGDADTILYGITSVLGVRTWMQNHVDSPNPMSLNTATVAPIVAIANSTWVVGDMTFGGITLGTAAALLIYHGIHLISKLRGTNLETATLASAPSGLKLEGEAYSKRHRPPAPQTNA